VKYYTSARGEDIMGISLDMMGFADNNAMNQPVQGDLLVEGPV